MESFDEIKRLYADIFMNEPWNDDYCFAEFGLYKESVQKWRIDKHN